MATAQALLLIEEVERAYVGLERIDRFAQAIRNFEQGRLAITCLPLFSQTLLPKACQRFHQQHSGVSVSILAQESPLLEESLVAQQHDLGLTEVEQIPRGAYGELLFSANMVCVLPEHHPLQVKAELELSDFHEVDFINLASLDTYRQRLDQHFRAAGVNRRTVIETTSAASVCAMVRQGLGVAIINAERAGGGARRVADPQVTGFGALSGDAHTPGPSAGIGSGGAVLRGVAGAGRRDAAGAGLIIVGAALCRDRAAKRPQQSMHDVEILGPLRGPFATQGRSHRDRASF